MSQECDCPSSFPDWDKQDVDLGGAFAHVLTVPMFLHMPVGFEAYVERQKQILERLRLIERWPGLVLARSAAFRGQIIRLLEDAVCPASHLEYLPSPFKVRASLHHGGIGTIARGIKLVQSELLEKGRVPRELYLCYLTCPRCSGQRGGDQILLLRRWTESQALQQRIKGRV